MLNKCAQTSSGAQRKDELLSARKTEQILPKCHFYSHHRWSKDYFISPSGPQVFPLSCLRGWRRLNVGFVPKQKKTRGAEVTVRVNSPSGVRTAEAAALLLCALWSSVCDQTPEYTHTHTHTHTHTQSPPPLIIISLSFFLSTSFCRSQLVWFLLS